ncbi:cytochrome c oxidase assembly protein [Microaerobacter geothermalis]|nr:cytochrome c oxidase assembly protein [Microaerobacter geothermalis]
MLWDNYSFTQLWSPFLLVFTISLGILYTAVVGPYQHYVSNSTPVAKGKMLLFYLGLVLFYLSKGSPLDLIGHQYLFSAHMFQQALLYLFVPPLLLIGTPSWLIRWVIEKLLIKKLLQFFTHPLIAIMLFNVLFSFYHIPKIFDMMMINPVIGTIYQVILFATSFLMWWPIIGPLPEMNRLSDLLKFAQIVGNGILLYPACALIILADSVLYQSYVGVPQLFAFLPTLDDQQLGGVIMKIMQEIALGTALAYTFFQWVRKEKEKEEPEPIS